MNMTGLFVIIFGIITGMIANKYNRNVIGWAIFGACFFILALPCILISGPSNQSTCAKCKETIKGDATVCKHCGSDV